MAWSQDPDPSLFRAAQSWWRDQSQRHDFFATLRLLVAELWAFLRDSTPEQRRRRYGDIDYDWEYRVDTTCATVSWRDRLLGVFHSPYQPTDPALFREMLEALDIDFSGFLFIDLGSGKGRTLLMAADFPFRKIIGVELLPHLHQVACENLNKYASPSQKCFAVESRCGDARTFEFPAEPTVLYLFNPLPEAGLLNVIENLERSLRDHPTQVCVLYHNPLLEHVLTASPALKRTGGTHQYSVYESV
jgi:SAM-dependent methyltransferase